MAKRRISNREMRAVAEQRMASLLSQAEREGLAGNMGRSRRYFRLARAIGMRTNTPLPPGLLYCRRCLVLLLPGRNCRVRLRDGKRVLHCLECDQVRRRPYSMRRGEPYGEKDEQEGAQGQGDRA